MKLVSNTRKIEFLYDLLHKLINTRQFYNSKYSIKIDERQNLLILI